MRFYCLKLCAFVLMIFGACYAQESIQNYDIPPKQLFLAKHYGVSHSEVYSTDIFPKIQKHFKIATIPPDRFTLRLKSVDVKLIFARYGYDLSFEDTFVEFEFVSDMRESAPLEFLEKMYIQYYGDNIEIKQIQLRPLHDLPKHYTPDDYDFNTSALKKNSGTFVMKYHTSSANKQATFLYQIHASLKVIKSTQNISINENLTLQNTKIALIDFEKNRGDLMTPDDVGNSGAKSYIRADLVITKDKIKPRIIVKKGDKIVVSSRQEGVLMEAVLIAKQNAIQNEIINAQNPISGKIIRVKITNEGKGEIL